MKTLDHFPPDRLGELVERFPRARIAVVGDFFLDTEGVYRFDPSKLPQAHQSCYRKFLHCIMREKRTIVVDNTNTSLWEMSPYVLAAEAHGYRVELRHLDTPIEKCLERQTHGVPEAALRAMAERFEAPLPWWEQYTSTDDGATFTCPVP